MGTKTAAAPKDKNPVVAPESDDREPCDKAFNMETARNEDTDEACRDGTG